MNNSIDLNIKNKYKILFVCLGNICRSPAAEAVFNHKLEEKKLTQYFFVDSAGTYGGHSGELPDRRMRLAAEKRGYTLTHHSRKITFSDFENFDLIVVMDNYNYDDVRFLAPTIEAKNKVCKMASFLEKSDFTYIPDPYYEGSEGFELVLNLLDESCENLLKHLKNKHVLILK